MLVTPNIQTGGTDKFKPCSIFPEMVVSYCLHSILSILFWNLVKNI